MKDTPIISPVSYPARVAPLPEDRVATEEVKGDDELEKERRRIEAENQNMMRRVLRVQEEKVPFPTLIRTDDSKKGKVVYDLKDALQLVKVGFLPFFFPFGLYSLKIIASNSCLLVWKMNIGCILCKLIQIDRVVDTFFFYRLCF